MSLPNFPPISPDLTRDQALNMILASIAMEELGLSHIINAEGEKIQYVLGTLSECPGPDANIHELVEVNNSVGAMLGSIMQNQMFLKNKLDRVLDFIGKGPDGPIGPAGPQGLMGPQGPAGLGCTAAFRLQSANYLWGMGCALPLCEVCADPCCDICLTEDCRGILLPCGRCCLVSFTLNVIPSPGCCCGVRVSLQAVSGAYEKNLFDYSMPFAPPQNLPYTLSASSVAISPGDMGPDCVLQLTLISPRTLIAASGAVSVTAT